MTHQRISDTHTFRYVNQVSSQYLSLMFNLGP